MKKLIDKLYEDGLANKYDVFIAKQKEINLQKSQSGKNIEGMILDNRKRMSQMKRIGSKQKLINKTIKKESTITDEKTEDEKQLINFNPLKFLSRELMLCINKTPFCETNFTEEKIKPLIFTGPSGVGKTTLINMILKDFEK